MNLFLPVGTPVVIVCMRIVWHQGMTFTNVRLGHR
ncbi:hypothetical protein CURTO8I2_320070 [Curtobacterium sp. 8I-2]|nr:hypothetical protein CURTO8I2_320070 [Curtobacterium sp. 8I-2]